MILGFVMAFFLCVSEGQEGPYHSSGGANFYILTKQTSHHVYILYMTRSIDEARSSKVNCLG